MLKWDDEDEKLTAAWSDSNGCDSRRTPPSPQRSRAWFCKKGLILLPVSQKHARQNRKKPKPSQHGDLVLQVEISLLFLLHALHGKHLSCLLLLHHVHLWEGTSVKQQTQYWWLPQRAVIRTISRTKIKIDGAVQCTQKPWGEGKGGGVFWLNSQASHVCPCYLHPGLGIDVLPRRLAHYPWRHGIGGGLRTGGAQVKLWACAAGNGYRSGRSQTWSPRPWPRLDTGATGAFIPSQPFRNTNASQLKNSSVNIKISLVFLGFADKWDPGY